MHLPSDVSADRQNEPMDFREVHDTWDEFDRAEGRSPDFDIVSLGFAIIHGDIEQYLRVIDVTPSLGVDAQALLQWQRRRDRHYAFYSVFGFGGIVRCLPQIIAAIDDRAGDPMSMHQRIMRADVYARMLVWIDKPTDWECRPRPYPFGKLNSAWKPSRDQQMLPERQQANGLPRCAGHICTSAVCQTRTSHGPSPGGSRFEADSWQFTSTSSFSVSTDH